MLPRLRTFSLARAFLSSLPLLVASQASAESWVRYNQAGYTPERSKEVVLTSDDDQAAQPWSVTLDGETVLEGVVGASADGVGPHTSHPFNAVIDLSALSQEGSYLFTAADAAPVTIRVSTNPYAFLIGSVLRHLRVERSGTDDVILREPSHFGDSQALLYRVAGDPADGAWEVDPSGDTVDMQGGWYDAADYIKFTLTIAHTTYFLLRAYEAHPDAFTKDLSTSELVDILDEAQFGLDYLMKTHPSEDVFVVQVSTGKDHDIGWRLPVNDTRDGKREALAAISPAHMGYTAAALARGARVFKSLGKDELAATYRAQAIAIFERARRDDALDAPAFERDATNDFYKDSSDRDNMALGAIELYELTDEADYLAFAQETRKPLGSWMSWGNVEYFSNLLIGAHDADALDDARGELTRWTNSGRLGGSVWHLPQQYTWASLPSWIGIGCAAALDAQADAAVDGSQELFWAMVDYTLGKNNWGKAMIASQQLPDSVQNIYSQIYDLTGEFPEGAVSEGPGDRATHDDMLQYFGGALDTSLEKFDTEAAVFYDDGKDFMTQEAVITGQGQTVFLLALASRGAVGESTPPEPASPHPNGSTSDNDSAPDDGGCGCRTTVGSPSALGGPLWMALAGALGLAWRRRRPA